MGVTLDGHVYAFDRATGRALLREPLALPGSPAAVTRLVPRWIADAGDAETDAVFGRNLDGEGLFTGITHVIFGNRFIVSNDRHPTRHRSNLRRRDDAGRAGWRTRWRLGEWGDLPARAGSGSGHRSRMAGAVVDHGAFRDGTGSTPAIRFDGERVALSDHNGNVITLDADLNEAWRVNVGDQIAASIAVSSDNDEMYGVTKFDVFKLIDHGDHAEIAWKAQLDAYPGFDNFNALTPTIAANGIAISLGAGRQVRDQHIMRAVGVGLRLDLLLRDATCAAADRVANTRRILEANPESARVDMQQVGVLLEQSAYALAEARREGSLGTTAADEIEATLTTASGAWATEDLPVLTARLMEICERLD